MCLQTYVNLPQELGERTNLSFLYNPESREMIIGSFVIAVVHLCPLQSGDHTDGNTHSAAVSVVLYNPLFKVMLWWLYVFKSALLICRRSFLLKRLSQLVV